MTSNVSLNFQEDSLGHCQLRPFVVGEVETHRCDDLGNGACCDGQELAKKKEEGCLVGLIGTL